MSARKHFFQRWYGAAFVGGVLWKLGTFVSGALPAVGAALLKVGGVLGSKYLLTALIAAATWFGLELRSSATGCTNMLTTGYWRQRGCCASS
jgi:hypothetical protein